MRAIKSISVPSPDIPGHAKAAVVAEETDTATTRKKTIFENSHIRVEQSKKKIESSTPHIMTTPKNATRKLKSKRSFRKRASTVGVQDKKVMMKVPSFRLRSASSEPKSSRCVSVHLVKHQSALSNCFTP